MDLVSGFLRQFRSAPPPSPDSARYEQQRQNYKTWDFIGYGPSLLYDPYDHFHKRIDFDNTVLVYAWPSRGGVILLEHASIADFEFLGFDRLNPPLYRHETSEEEDAFAQKLLLLGAKWWDSMARYRMTKGLDYRYHEAVQSAPETAKESTWVSVTWPSTGGVLLSEREQLIDDGGVEQDSEPEDVARLLFCTTMDEKAVMLQEQFDGKLWNSVEEYDGNAFISTWSTKVTGEAGSLLRLWPHDTTTRGGE